MIPFMRHDLKTTFVFVLKLLMSSLRARSVTIIRTCSSRDSRNECSFITVNSHLGRRKMVNFFGYANVSLHRRTLRNRIKAKKREEMVKTDQSTTTIEMNPPLLSNHRFSQETMFEAKERPPDPLSVLATPEDLHRQVSILFHWWEDKKRVICLTGAGLSTESGIPDYRGHNGSYHIGHKPMIHDHFMKSEEARQRYWGRGMVGWRYVDKKEPSAGHYALAQLEKYHKLGTAFDDRPEFYADESDFALGSGQQQLSLITQNVDSLHRRAGTKHILELHGRNDRLFCMHCGYEKCRTKFHDELEQLNKDWLNDALSITKSSDMRADGDAAVDLKYKEVVVPSCHRCSDGFYKPDVVFFGDNVPSYRVKLFQAAVDNCDGLLVVGSSLAVHSAFRHVKSAHKQGIPIAILNVGETRAEIEKLDVLKVEAPAGPTLEQLANIFSKTKQ